MFEVISKIQNKTALFVKAQRERIGLEQNYKGRKRLNLVGRGNSGNRRRDWHEICLGAS